LTDEAVNLAKYGDTTIDGGLTIQSDKSILVDGGLLCNFSTDPDGVTPAVDMKWQSKAIVIPGNYIVKDGNNNLGDAGIAATTNEQLVELMLSKVAEEKCIVEGDPDEKFCPDVEYTFTATLLSAKIADVPELSNCKITDDTFATPVAGPFELTTDVPEQEFKVNFDIFDKTTNLATLTCTDQFDVERTATATWTIEPFNPSVDLKKEVEGKVAVGGTPVYKFTVTNTGDLPITACVITDNDIGVVIPILDGDTPKVLDPNDVHVEDSVKGIQIFAAFKNTAEVVCTYQLDGKVSDMDMITVTPVAFGVEMSKECEPKEVVLPGQDLPTIDCEIKVWKTEGSTDLSACTVTDDSATPDNEGDDSTKVIALLSATKDNPVVIPISYSFTLEQVKAGEGSLTNSADVECTSQEDLKETANANATTEVLFPEVNVVKACEVETIDGVTGITWSWKITNTSPDMITSLAVTASGELTLPDGTVGPEPGDTLASVVLGWNEMSTGTFFTTGDSGKYTDSITAVGEYQEEKSVEDDASVMCDIPPELKGGCTPGYWKGNADNWDAVSWVNPLYQPDTTLAAAGFVTDRVDNSATLREALSFKGGNFAKGGTESNLLRHGVANLLNAANSDVGSPIGSPAAVIAFVNTAIATDDKSSIESAKSTLAAANEAGCTINQQGIPSTD
jgi:hypothetical protein